MSDAITLTSGQRQALEAVVSEHAESRRGAKLLIVQAYCGAKDAAGQEKVRGDLAKLRGFGLIREEGGAVLPTPAGIQHCQQEPASMPAAAQSPKPAAPMGSGFKKRAAQRAAEGLKTCRHCRVQFRRPDEAPIPHDRCERCHEEIEATTTTPATRPAKTCQAAGCDRPALEVPNASLCGECRSRMKWPEGQAHLVPGALTVSPDLLDRCAAMHLSLLEQARTAYAEGDEAAGRELRWLLETGKQLVAVGGGV